MAANRRQYTAEFKAKVVLHVLSGEKTTSEICRTHKLNVSGLNRWRKEFVEQAASIFEQAGASKEDQQRIAELERLVGQLTMQLEIAKKASNYGVADSWDENRAGCLELRSKSSRFSATPELLERGQKREAVMGLSQEYPIATVCGVLDYPRSQVYYEPQPTAGDCKLNCVKGQKLRSNELLTQRHEHHDHPLLCLPG